MPAAHVLRTTLEVLLSHFPLSAKETNFWSNVSFSGLFSAVTANCGEINRTLNCCYDFVDPSGSLPLMDTSLLNAKSPIPGTSL